MIKVTRLNGEELFLNYFQIEYLESIPETKIKMMNGDFYLVTDTVESILRQIEDFLHRWQPAYKDYHLELGEVSSYPPGYKENAGIFCHNNPWISIAETCVGHGNRAFDVYRKICPAYIENISEIHRTEPYVYSQMIAGKDAKNFGEAKNSWLTSSPPPLSAETISGKLMDSIASERDFSGSSLLA